MTRRHRYALCLTPVLALLLISRGLVPAPPRALNPTSSSAGEPVVWAGAYHIHTTLSDGSGTPADVAAAAAEVGLDFVILTDHGDGTRNPSPPAYVSGVLVIDAVEISTADGHYVALGLPQTPYRLAGEGRDVAEDVTRLGGIGILAHPDSARPTLAWRDPETRGDGLEILNADSAWRDESVVGLLRRLLPYPWRPSAVLATTLEYPPALLERLDTPATDGPRLALAGVDAHARVGLRPRDEPLETSRTIARLPSYRASLGTFGLAMSWRNGTVPTGDGAIDAAAVLSALRDHATQVVVFALADPAVLAFDARTATNTFLPGARVSTPGRLTLSVAAPPTDGVRVRLLRNGRPWREQAGASLSVEIDAASTPGVYRAEAWLPRGWQQPTLPWLLSQAIAIDVADRGSRIADRGSRIADRGSQSGAGGDAETTPESDNLRNAPDNTGIAISGPWRVEHDPGSTVAITSAGLPAARVDIDTRLGDGRLASRFAAAVVPWPEEAIAARHVTFRGTATRPMRVSVQVREPVGADGRRWIRSVYLDSTPRDVRIALDDMRAVPPTSGHAPAGRLHALLFVVDTVNAAPGDHRGFSIEQLRVH